MLSLFALFNSVSRRYLGKRWDRALLIVASIALGVAMLVSTQQLNQCLDAAAHESTSPGADPADLVVTNNSRTRIDLTERLRGVAGVDSAQAVIFERVLLPEFDDRTAVLIGVDIPALLADSRSAKRNAFDVKFREGFDFFKLPTSQSAGVADELAAKLSTDGKLTKPFQIRGGGRIQPIEPAGVFELGGKAKKLGGFVIAMDVRQAAKALDQEGLCERIDLYLAPDADKESVRQRAQDAIGKLGAVQTPDQAAETTREVVGGIRIGFTLCGVGAMVVGLFLVYNALAVSVAERRHDIGVLRSMGATRPQIAGLFTGESLILGLIGSLLGVPLGWALAKLTFLLVRVDMQQLFVTANQPMDVKLETFLLAVGSGLLASWLAALVPAMQAASDEPADAVRRAPSSVSKFFHRLQVIASLAMISLGFSFVLIREQLPKRVGGYGGMVLLLVGMLLAVPFLVGVMAQLLQPLSRRIFGIEIRLASDNLLRAPGRTGVVVGALAAGVALMFQTAGIGKSNEEPILDWLERAVSADLIVICGDPKSSSSALPMQPEVAREIKNIPGVEEAMALRYRQPDFAGRKVFLTAIDAKIYHDSNRNRSKLPNIELFLELSQPNTCLVSENFAALNKVKEGDTITLPGLSEEGPVSLKILGVVQEYVWARGSILVDRAFYAKAFQDKLIDGVHVFLKPGDPDAAQRVKEYTDKRALVIMTRRDFDELITSFIRRMYTLAYMQQIAVGIVAALGVVMALLISVLQRRRELGLLRAVGATQAQVLATVLAEATLMGILGTLLGVLAGLPLEWYLLRVVIYEESGFIFPVSFPWRETLVLSVLAVGTATIAGLFPALHAVRLRIAEAIAYE